MGLGNCFSCGKGFNGDTNALLRKFKEEYDKKGIVRYFYKTETNGTIKIVRAKTFKAIYENEIKANFSKGAEYSHIEEFRGI